MFETVSEINERTRYDSEPSVRMVDRHIEKSLMEGLICSFVSAGNIVWS